MKKTFLTLAAAVAMIFSVQTATAQVTGEEQIAVEEQATHQEDWEAVEVLDLPAEIQQAVERDFQGATVSEAYVKEKDGEKKYNIVLATQQGQTRELYADAQGNWIDKDKKKDKDQE